MIASPQPNPWYHSHSFAAYGLTWSFEYLDWAAKRTLSTEGLKLDVPINATFRFTSPQAWLDKWAKKRGNMAKLERLRPPSTEPEVKQLSLLETVTSKELPVANEQPKIIHLDLEEIRRDGGTQPRAKIDLLHVRRLEEQIEDGHELEPAVVFHDGEFFWMADGFHRWHAHKNQEQPTIAALVHQGSRREAVLYSVGANADHKPALPRSREDKRRAVMTLIQDEVWGQWSDREIARRCKVNNATVSRIRASLLQCNSDKTSESNTQERIYTTKHGTVATMNTTNIGTFKSDNSSELSKPPIMTKLREGINYKPGNSGCEHYVKVEQSTWESLKQYQEEVGTVTVDAAIARMLEELTPKPVPTDDVCIAITSNIELLNEQQLEAVVKAIAYFHPDLIRQVMGDCY
jgi:hypothetical protein